MYKLGERSLKQYNTLHPKLQKIIDIAIKTHDLTVLEGARTLETQKEYVAKGVSKTLDSKHIPPSLPAGHPLYGKSRAMDVIPYPINWDYRERLLALAFYLKGIANALGIKVRLGADWDGDLDMKDQTFHDVPHIELDDSEV